MFISSILSQHFILIHTFYSVLWSSNSIQKLCQLAIKLKSSDHILCRFSETMCSVFFLWAQVSSYFFVVHWILKLHSLRTKLNLKEMMSWFMVDTDSIFYLTGTLSLTHLIPYNPHYFTSTFILISLSSSTCTKNDWLRCFNFLFLNTSQTIRFLTFTDELQLPRFAWFFSFTKRKRWKIKIALAPQISPRQGVNLLAYLLFSILCSVSNILQQGSNIGALSGYKLSLPHTFNCSFKQQF